ncbi:MAG: DUF2889 domain-containing protein, partial [Chloroflexota bacterium]
MSVLTFSRSKVVGVESPEENVLLAHGILEDPVYGMEVDVRVKLPEFEVVAVQGRMKRFTTPECEKSIPRLQNAVGLCIYAGDFVRKVNRMVGREGCTHFANLVIECCDAVMQAAIFGKWLELKEKGATPSKEEFLRER